MDNNHSRLLKKHNAVEFKDDDYETPSNILNDLVTYIPEGIIYDPFYCNGKVIEEWKKLNKVCINEKKDAFTWKPENFDFVENVTIFQNLLPKNQNQNLNKINAKRNKFH